VHVDDNRWALCLCRRKQGGLSVYVDENSGLSVYVDVPVGPKAREHLGSVRDKLGSLELHTQGPVARVLGRAVFVVRVVFVFIFILRVGDGFNLSLTIRAAVAIRTATAVARVRLRGLRRTTGTTAGSTWVTSGTGGAFDQSNQQEIVAVVMQRGDFTAPRRAAEMGRLQRQVVPSSAAGLFSTIAPPTEQR